MYYIPQLLFHLYTKANRNCNVISFANYFQIQTIPVLVMNESHGNHGNSYSSQECGKHLTSYTKMTHDAVADVNNFHKL